MFLLLLAMNSCFNSLRRRRIRFQQPADQTTNKMFWFQLSSLNSDDDMNKALTVNSVTCEGKLGLVEVQSITHFLGTPKRTFCDNSGRG